jgi:hypothetical protein
MIDKLREASSKQSLTSLTHQTGFSMVVRSLSLSLSPSILFALIILGFFLGSVSANCQGCSTLVIKVRTPIFCSHISVL